MEISGHNFIEIEYNPRLDWSEAYDTYKCINCGFYLFYYKHGNYFWSYKNGIPYNLNKPIGHFDKVIDNMVDISCEEKIIKNLLE